MSKQLFVKRKNNNKYWILTAAIISLVIVLTISLNSILENTLRQIININLEKYNSSTNKIFSIGTSELNIWERTLIIKNISIVPDSTVFNGMKNGSLKQVSSMGINIPLLKIRKLGILKMLTKRDFSLKEIVVEGVEFTVYKNNLKVRVENNESNLSLDSVYIAGLKNISLNRIEFKSYSYTSINITTNDTLFSFRGNDFEINGLELDKVTDSEKIYTLNTKKLSLRMQEQHINFRDENYSIALGELNYLVADGTISLLDFALKPTLNKYKLGASYKYTKEVFDVKIKSINIFGYNVAKALKQGVINIDSVLIDGANIDIYKDRRLPFNLDNRPLFIQQKLKKMKQPLHIKNVRVSNGNFNFSLHPKNSKQLLQVGISNISGNIGFITSIKDSLQSGKQLTVNVKGILMDASPLQLKIKMPYNKANDSFYITGKLGSGSFTKFNPALHPVTGIKFKNGRLKSLRFYANASPSSSVGQMTMLYTNLQAEIPKKNIDKKNKFLSLGANTVLHASNPSRNGKIRISTIKTDRVLYKGFGNLLWKTVQSGIVNTVLVTGESHKKAEQKTQTKGRRKKRKK